MSWTGTLLHIFVAERAAAPMCELKMVRLIEGVGLEGDRYALGLGHYSTNPRPDRQVTLCEMETLEALRRDYQIGLTPAETRRNLITLDVPLNHLVGRRFRVGEAVLYGARLNIPCQYLEDLLGKPVLKPLLHRSGLNCQIVEGGVIRPGDVIQPAADLPTLEGPGL